MSASEPLRPEELEASREWQISIGGRSPRQDAIGPVVAPRCPSNTEADVTIRSRAGQERGSSRWSASGQEPELSGLLAGVDRGGAIRSRAIWMGLCVESEFYGYPPP
jgi:hypothetical protein